MEDNTEKNMMDIMRQFIDSDDKDKKSPEVVPASPSPVQEAEEEKDEHHEDDNEFASPPDDFEREAENKSREELLEMLHTLAKSDVSKISFHQLDVLKSAFDHLLHEEKDELLKKYIADGGEEDGFEYRFKKSDTEFYELYKTLKTRRKENIKDINRQRKNNLVQKQAILERLREFVDADETNFSLNKLKNLREEWNAVGPVPQENNKELWANFHALMDRFYNNRSMYQDLKDLDRKKNLEAKIAICEKAEALEKETHLKKAIDELNLLHAEYKTIGPVPQEVNEEIWQRLKKASDTLLEKRRVMADAENAEREANLTLKMQLLHRAEEIAAFTSDKAGDWKGIIKEVLELEEKWKQIRNIPRKHVKSLNDKFWESIKTFFKTKNEFFKNFDKQVDELLAPKKELIEKAKALLAGADVHHAANEFKNLQQQWKNLPFVASKKEKHLFEDFKAAGDALFASLRDSNKAKEAEMQANMAVKAAVAERGREMAAGPVSHANIKQLVEEWNAAGALPAGYNGDVALKFSQALDALVQKADDIQDKPLALLTLNAEAAKTSPDAEKFLQKSKAKLSGRLKEIEAEVNTWTTNMDFFARSKNAQKILDEFKEKIAAGQSEIKELKDRIKLIDRFGRE